MERPIVDLRSNVTSPIPEIVYLTEGVEVSLSWHDQNIIIHKAQELFT
jgi:hypothetical protein